MSVIASTNSTCSINKIEYRGAQAVIYIKITAFAKTYPEKGVMIFFKDSGSDTLNPAFQVSSDNDAYQNKIFWINNSTLTGHTYQNVEVESIIPVYINLAKGVYKNGHLYREISLILVDYENEKEQLWVSQPIHLCSGPLDFNITGVIIPKFTYAADETYAHYHLSIDYKFSEDSWLFNLNHPDLVLELSVQVKQSTEFTTKEIVVATMFGTWENVSNEIEETAHVIITAKLKLDKATIWSDELICVPGEVPAIYTKKDNDIYIITHKAIQHNALTKDAHIYTPIIKTHKLSLVIVPWKNYLGIQHKGSYGQPLYTLSPCVQNIYGKYVPIDIFFAPSVSINKLTLDDEKELILPNNLTGNLYNDFPTILYNNYDVDTAERALSQMRLLNAQINISLNGISAVKQPILIIDKAEPTYIIGNIKNSGLFIGSADKDYSLIIQKGENQHAE